jgi:hypothetical protein
MKTIAGEVAFAAITRRRRYRATDRGLYWILLTNGVVVFAPDPPALYDANAVAMVTQPIGVGSTVRISVDAAGWMTAVQIVSLVSACPFQPVVGI